MTEQRSALIVANDSYSDPKLRQLRAPAQDARALADVLSDPQIGGFDVHVAANEPEHELRRRVSRFFADRKREDLLLLHISCHGVKDEDGRLYFAAPDTEVGHLDATAVPADFVTRRMNESRSKRIVLLLDCCYSGAFAAGVTPRGGDAIDLKERFGGRGHVVLTATSAMEYAFEGDDVVERERPSIFTSAVVDGLRTGRADRDGDRLVSVDELYEWVFDQVADRTPNQKPGKWTFGVEGDLFIARNPHAPPPPAHALPDEIQAMIESPLAGVREGAVHELARLLRSSNAQVAQTARRALEQLRNDDSRTVAAAADRAIGPTKRHRTVHAPPPPPPPAQVAVPADVDALVKEHLSFMQRNMVKGAVKRLAEIAAAERVVCLAYGAKSTWQMGVLALSDTEVIWIPSETEKPLIRIPRATITGVDEKWRPTGTRWVSGDARLTFNSPGDKLEFDTTADGCRRVVRFLREQGIAVAGP